MKVISLFSGIGGLDYGFKKAGFDIIWANDNNKKVLETYEKNHKNIKFDTRSIKNIPLEEIPDCEGIIGGPPCQSWSIAGSKKGINDKRGKLFYTYIKIIREKQPKFFLAENVPGMLYKNNIKEFKEIIKLLSDSGYNVSYKTINTKNYGIPQIRKRIIIVGIREDFKDKFIFKDKNIKKITLREAIGHLPEPMRAKEKNKTNKKLKMNGHEYFAGGFSSRFMSRNRNKKWDELAYTVEASGRHAKVHPEYGDMTKIEKDKWVFDYPRKVRRFSIRESAIIQGFPNNFLFYYKNLNDGYKMIGNAVPPPLAKIIALDIKEFFERREA